jgi:predicted signal transduction protein with EAL and GGDEF domain
MICSSSNLLRFTLGLLIELQKSDFLTRPHGDEFLILIELLEDSVQSYSAAKKISTTLQSSISVKCHQVFGSASVGIATFPEISTADALVERTDRALDEAKRKRSQFAASI